MGVFPSTLRRMIIALNGCEGPEYFQAGAATIKPGMIVVEDDADEVKISEETTYPIGVAGCDADHDLSTAYSSGERIPVYMLGSGVDIYVLCKDVTTVDVIKGDIIETSDTAAHDGQGKVKDGFVAITTTGAAAITERTSTIHFYIGRALETGSITSAVARYIPVRLSL